MSHPKNTVIKHKDKLYAYNKAATIVTESTPMSSTCTHL